jgi:hypothetical protein
MGAGVGGISAAAVDVGDAAGFSALTVDLDDAPGSFACGSKPVMLQASKMNSRTTNSNTTAMSLAGVRIRFMMTSSFLGETFHYEYLEPVLWKQYPHLRVI